MAVNKPFVKKGNNFNFQYDIDPKHTATQVKLYSGRKTHNGKLSVMNCPPQSPNLYILEEMRDQFDLEEKKRWLTFKVCFCLICNISMYVCTC